MCVSGPPDFFPATCMFGPPRGCVMWCCRAGGPASSVQGASCSGRHLGPLPSSAPGPVATSHHCRPGILFLVNS